MADGGQRPRSRDDVLTPAAVAAELGMRECDALTWLRARHLVGDVDGRPRVVWGDVLDAIRASARPAARAPVRATVALDPDLTPLRGHRKHRAASTP